MPLPSHLAYATEVTEGFYVGVDHDMPESRVRLYHDPCATDVAFFEGDVALDTIVRSLTAHSCPPPMTPKEALDWAIFSVNNHTDPDASEDADVRTLDAKADEVRGLLVDLRDRLAQDDALTDDPITSVLTAPGIDADKVAGLGSDDPAMPGLLRAGARARAKDAADRQIQVTHLMTVSADASDADVAGLVTNMTVQAEDPRDGDGEDVTFTTSKVEADWFTVKTPS